MVEITRTLTDEQTNLNNVSTYVLRLTRVNNMREDFRINIENRLSRNNNILPNVTSVESESVIDRNDIIEINNRTSSEQRETFLRNFLSLENSDSNRLFLIENLSNEVREYLNNFLIRVSTNYEVLPEDLYRVGNILMYTVSNISIDELYFRDIVQLLRESMVLYNSNQTISIFRNFQEDYNFFLNRLGLLTDEQFQIRTNEFLEGVNHQITLNRRRMIYTGIGFIGSLALSSFGLPPIGGLITRSLIGPFNLNTMPMTSTHSVEDIVRLRDIWDAIILKTLKIIK